MKIPKNSILLLAAAVLLWPISIPAIGLTFLPKLASLFCVLCAAIIFLRQDFENQKVKRLARSCLALLLVGCMIVCISFVWIEGLIVRGAAGTADKDAAVAVVLGTGLRGDRPSAALVSRLQAAQVYLGSHPDAVAILTGAMGPSETRTEASAMAEWLIDRGIDETRLLLEEKAHNTAQNIKFSVALMAQYGLPQDSVLVISNEFHLYRAQKIFERYGIDAASLPAPTPSIGFLRVNSYAREYCSVVVMILKDLLGIDE